MFTKFKLIFSVVAVASGFAVQSQAGTLTFNWNPDGGGAPGVLVNSLDLAPGNALATNVVTGAGLGVGDTFDLFYQSVYTSALLNNVPVAGSAVGGGGEITAVARFPEIVTGVLASGTASTAFFGTDSVGENYFRLYYDAAANSDASAGTGYDDGTLILEAKVIDGEGAFSVGNNTDSALLDQFGADDLGGQLTVRGQGSSAITAVVEYFDSSFFIDGFDAVNTLTFALFDGTNQTPFRQVNPSQEFAFAGVTPDLGAVNGLTGPDFQFQADSSIVFDQVTVPEPGSIAVFAGLGVFGLAGVIRRRRRA